MAGSHSLNWHARALVQPLSAFLALFLLFSLFPPAWSTLTVDQVYENSTRLRDGLLASYKKTLPPGGGVAVRIQLALYQIVEVSTPLQTIKFTGWWRHYWTDKRMAWDAEKWGVESIVFAFDEIWIPDDLIYELIDDEPIGDAVVTAYPSGSMFYSRPRVSVVKCPMKLNSFPFDTQTCYFTVGSLAYDSSMVDILPRAIDGTAWFEEPMPGEGIAMLSGIDLASFDPNPEYGLHKVKVISRNQFYSCCVFPYPVLKFEFVVVRMSLTYVTGIVIPLIVVSFVGFFAMLMPSPLSGARPTLSVGILYTSSAIYLVAAENMPQIGTFTVIGRLYIASLLASLLMILVSILTTGVNLVIAEDKQHRSDLMTMFRHFDADKSGTLDVKEADNALNSLGLNQYERNSILLECNMEAQMVVTADEWIQMAELARKYRPSTQYNVIIGKFIRMMTSLAYKDKYRQEQELLSQNRLLQESFQRAPSVAIQANKPKIASARPTPRQMNEQPAPPADPANKGKEMERLPVPEAETELVHGWAFGNGTDEAHEHGIDIDAATSKFSAVDTAESVVALVDHPSSPNGYANGNSSPIAARTERDLITITEWLNDFGYGEEVVARFVEEEIDIASLSEMSAQQVAMLGVGKLGHQLKLIKLSKDKLLKIDHYKKNSGGKKALLQNRRDSVRSLGMEAPTMERAVSFRPTGPYKVAGGAALPDTTSVTPKFLKKHEIKVSGKAAHNVKHLGAVIDWWSTIIFPALFMIYLIIEFAGGFLQGDTVQFSQPNSQIVDTISEFVNERELDGTDIVKASNEHKMNVCFQNFQILSPVSERHVDVCDQIDYDLPKGKTLVLNK